LNDSNLEENVSEEEDNVPEEAEVLAEYNSEELFSPIDMSSPNLPSFFWQRPEEEPTVTWKNYKRTFAVYVRMKTNFFRASLRLEQNPANPEDPAAEAATLSAIYPDSMRNDELWTCLGAEGRRHFNTVTDADSFNEWSHAKMIEELDSLFGEEKNSTVAFIDLIRWTKRQDETVNNFLTELRCIVKDCDFGQKEDHLLKVVLVCNCGDQDLQEKICANKDCKEVDDVLAMMRAYEKVKTVVKTG
jgi:hypothetical protein